MLKEIFVDNWSKFLSNNKVRPSVVKEVNKMVNCSILENGFRLYTCQKCGAEKYVPFTCKSRFCSKCGKLYRDKWAEQLSLRLLHYPHKHVVFTIPKELREKFRKNRELLKDLSDAAAKVLKETVYEYSKTNHFEIGVITVIHTFGRDLKWNPHIHVIMSTFMVGKKETRILQYINYEKLRKFWQKEVLDIINKNFRNVQTKRIINTLYREKDNGFYVYAKGVIKNIETVSKYIARYAGRPAIAESRIIAYDGKIVKIKVKPHGKNIEEILELSVDEFIKRVIVHIPESNFKMMRCYGYYARNSKVYKGLSIDFVLKKHQKEFYRRKLLWAFRIELMYGVDPLKCECGGRMILEETVLPPNYLERRKRRAC